MKVLSAIVAVLVVAAIAGYMLATRNPSAPPAASAPRRVVVAAQDRLTRAIKHPTPVATPPAETAFGAPTREFAVRIGRADVNTILSSNKQALAQMRAHGVQAAQVAFEPPSGVRVDAWMHVEGSMREVSLAGTVAPDGLGGVTFHSTSAKIGMLPLPAGITASRIDSEAQQLLDQAVPSLPVRVESITVTKSALIVSGPARRTRRGTTGHKARA